MELTIHQISKSYHKDVLALDGASFTIPTGVYGLIGRNGAGKTLLSTWGLFFAVVMLLAVQLQCLMLMNVHQEKCQ